MKFYSFDAFYLGLLGKHLSTSGAYKWRGKPKDEHVYFDETNGFFWDSHNLDHPVVFSPKIKQLIPVGKIINIGGFDYVAKWEKSESMYHRDSEYLGFDIL